MGSVPLVPRWHLFEIDDQPWFPAFLRARVQAALTLFWTIHVPILQHSSACSLVSTLLRQLLGPDIFSFTYVDFCAGAGGPTPSIERVLNGQLLTLANKAISPPFISILGESHSQSDPTGSSKDIASPSEMGVDFVLTDIAPHPTAWSRASKQSPRLHYVTCPIDAAAAPKNLLSELIVLSPIADESTPSRLSSRPPFRLYFLAFHHFSDPLASAILSDTMKNSSGFGIFELQDRSLGGLTTVLALAPVLWLTSWYYFRRDLIMLFWTYVIPVIPFVIVFDGIVSCLRTRTAVEITDLLEKCGVDRENWRMMHGTEQHTWPAGNMTWFVGMKRQ